jgi:anti-sigma B factor antagonist
MPYLTCSAGTLEIRAEEELGEVCVAVYGELDLVSAPTLRAVLHRLIAERDRVVLDLSGLDFMDSSGAHLLVEAHLHARLTGCRLGLLRGNDQVQLVLEIARLTERLPFEG